MNRISAVVSDVDGTLVRDDKSLSDANLRAVSRLRDAGVALAIVSSRPPRGLTAVIESLNLSTMAAGFNGGVITTPQLAVLEQHLLSPQSARVTVDLLAAGGADVWVFSGQDWFLQNPDASHVAREARTVQFTPTVVGDFGAALDAAAKIVGVSADPALLTRCEAALIARLGGEANVVRSQSYYLDVTHALANKGEALRAISRRLAIPLDEIAVIGDGANDVAMFGPSAVAIAMGNAEPAVRRAADFVTDSNNDDGFATAIDRYVLAGDFSASRTGASQ